MTTPRTFLSFDCNTGFKNLLRSLGLLLVATTALLAHDEDPSVLYEPGIKLIEGDQPLSTSYVLSITSPVGVPVTVTPVVSVVTAPAGISNATALSFVTLSSSSLAFTAPGQTLSMTVSVNVPEGTAAGDYVWAIATTGWPTGTIDVPAAINAKVSVPRVPFPPTVTLTAPLDGTVYNYTFGGAPVSIDVAFTATTQEASPLITSIDADLSGAAISLASTGIGSSSVQANGTIQVTLPGIYTVRARATNGKGTSSDTAEVTVRIQAPPPVVAILQPVASAFVYTGSTLTVPFSFTSTSLHGGTTALSATLNGTPVSVMAGGLGSLLATGSGSLAINGAGTYTLVVTGTTQHGTTSATKTFTVTAAQILNPPVVSISQPLNGATFTRVAGSAATSIPFAFTAVADTGATIATVTASLNGNSVIVAASGLGSANAGGTGTLSVSAPGTYTFAAGATSGTLSGSKSVSFTVTETHAPTADCTIEWLPPISLGKVQKGGSVLPIKFALNCGCGPCGHDRDDDCNRHSYRGNGYGHQYSNGNGHNRCNHRSGRDRDDDCSNQRDTSVVIFIYEIRANGTTTEPEIFTYSRRGNCDSDDGTYAINGNHYQLNFDTARGTHRYHIDVYRSVAGSTTPQLLGTKEFTTR